MSDRAARAASQTARQRLVRRLGTALRGDLRRRLGKISLAQLEDSRRPLLFSRLPRMVRGDGGTPKPLQAAFAYVDRGRKQESALPVSVRRWTRALATSRRLASRRSARAAAMVDLNTDSDV